MLQSVILVLTPLYVDNFEISSFLLQYPNEVFVFSSSSFFVPNGLVPNIAEGRISPLESVASQRPIIQRSSVSLSLATEIKLWAWPAIPSARFS